MPINFLLLRLYVGIEDDSKSDEYGYEVKGLNYPFSASPFISL